MQKKENIGKRFKGPYYWWEFVEVKAQRRKERDIRWLRGRVVCTWSPCPQLRKPARRTSAKYSQGNPSYYYGTKKGEHISFVTGILILNRCFELRRVTAGTIVSQRYCTFHDSGLVYNLLHHIFRTFGGNRRL